MTKRLDLIFLAIAATIALSAATPSQAQTMQPAGTAVQREAIARLAFLDGEWRGTATTFGSGGAVVLTQTERVGPLLGGSIRVIEGHGYSADGATIFNAMAIVAWDEAAARYDFRTYANGMVGTFPFEVTADGFRWETPAGPGAKIQYVATVKDGRWDQTGDYVVEGQAPRRYIELKLQRLGHTDWPAGDAVPPTP